jgi:hypothetical protein
MLLPALFTLAALSGTPMPVAEVALEAVEARQLAERYSGCVYAAAIAMTRRAEPVGDLAVAAEQRCWTERDRLTAWAFDRAAPAAELQRFFARIRARIPEMVARLRSEARAGRAEPAA